ncbi:hypothetical protein [Flavobacterium sp.]|uniref:hypothetical protein n=1 Tax=Flavobacterium sp. TaxID=239 RepID=UPI0026191E81|nr:hypothetical protein [Flavobacterium sp.]
MKKIALFIFLLFTFCTYAQKQNNTYNSDSKLNVFIAPLPLIDVFDGSSIRLGVDFKVNRKFRAAIESGTYFSTIDAYKINPRGFIIKPEIKFKVYENDHSKQFIGIEYQYKEQSYDFKDSISVVEGVNYEMQYKINRKMNCISLKCISLQNLSEKITFEYFFGIGIRFLRSKNNLSDEENDGILDDEIHGGTQAEYQIRPIGKINTVNLIAGIRFGYKIF